MEKTPLSKFQDSSFTHVNMSYAPFNKHQNFKGNNVQAKTFPMYLASKNVSSCEAEVNEGIELSTTILHVGIFPVFDVHQDPQNMGSNISIKSFEMEDARIDSYLLHVCKGLTHNALCFFAMHGMGTSKSIAQNIVTNSM